MGVWGKVGVDLLASEKKKKRIKENFRPHSYKHTPV